MARRLPPKRTETELPEPSETEVPPDRPTLPGGELGVNLERPETKVGGAVIKAPPKAAPGARPRAPEPSAVQPRFVVVSAPPRVMYDGQVIILAPGKIMTPATHNLELLQKQGVVLKPLGA